MEPLKGIPDTKSYHASRLRKLFDAMPQSMQNPKVRRMFTLYGLH